MRRLALCLAALVVAGCGGERQERPLTVLTYFPVEAGDPATGSVMTTLVHRPLFSYFGESLEPQPDLAAGPARVAPDGRSLLVRLRRGVRFAPPVGREVVAEDVRYAIERGFTRSVSSPFARSYFGSLIGAARFADGRARHIAGIELPDAHTIRFRLDSPRAALVAEALTLPLTAPVPPEVARPLDRGERSRYAERVVASGPYMPVASKPGELRLERNPSWDPASDPVGARSDVIVWRRNDDLAIAARQVLSGEGSVLGPSPPPPPNILADLARGRWTGQSTPPVDSGGWTAFAFNTQRPPLDDADLRRAIVAAFDRAFVRRAFGGPLVGTVASHFIPPGVPGFAEAGGERGPGLDFLAAPDGDLRVARRYLRRAGYPSGRYTGPPLLALVPAGLPLGDLLKAQLARLGIGVRVRQLAPETFSGRCTAGKADYDICFWTWTRDYNDAETVLYGFDGRIIDDEVTPNVTRLDDPEVNRAIARAAVTVDPAKRARAWARVDRLVTATAAAVPLVWPRTPLLSSRDVEGVPNRMMGGWELRLTRVKAD